MTQPGQKLDRNAARLRVTNGHRAAVCALILVGLTYPEACRIVGAPPVPLRALLGRDWTGRQQTQRPRRWKGDELRDLEEAYRDRNLSLRSIAQMFGTHPGNISTMAKEHGWPPRSRPHFPRGHIAAMPAEQRRLYLKLRAVVGRVEAERAAAA